MSNNPNFPKVGVEFVAQNAPKYFADVDQARVKLADFITKVSELRPQIERSRLSLDDQAKAFGVLESRIGIAETALEKFANTAKSKTAGAAVSAVDALGKSIADIGRASAASATEPTARSSQGIIDAQIALARAQQDYAKALALVAQARASAAGDEERLAELDVRAIQIQRQQAKALGETKDAVTGLTQAEKERLTTEAALASQQRQALDDAALAQSKAIGAARPSTTPSGILPHPAEAQMQGQAVAFQALEKYAAALDKASVATDKLSARVAASDKTDAEKLALTARLTGALAEQKKAYDALFAAIQSGDTGKIASATQGYETALKKTAQATEQVRGAVRNTGTEADRLGTHFTSASSAIGASRVGVGLFTRELVQMAGGSTVATQALDSFVYSTGTLGVALAVITVGLGVIHSTLQTASDDFQKHQTEIANTTRSYEELYAKLAQAHTTSFGGILSGTSDVKDALLEGVTKSIGAQLGHAYGEPFVKAFHGDLAGMFSDIVSDANIIAAWAHVGENAGRLFVESFRRKQEESATQLFVQGAQTRANAQALGLEIGQLQLEGKSFDELVPKIYAYLQAKKAIGEAEGSGIGGAITGADVESFAQSAFPSAALSAKAQTLYKQLRDVQSQYNEDSANLASEHGSRILEIETHSWEQQLRLAREFSQRKKAIQDQYEQDTADALSDRDSRIADAEKDAQERRDKIVEEHADRRAKIEQDYQDRVAQIQSDYQMSLFDIVAKDDAKGLVRARLQRDKALADAARTRDRENAENEKQKAKQEKELRDSLDRQKREIEQAYEKRLRDLLQAFNKQNAANNQNYADALADLKQSTADQYNAENASYTKRQKALDDAKQKRIDALTDELFTTKALYEKYGQAIIDSLSKVLDPATIVDLVNGLQKALDTKIEIKITPNAGTDGASAGKQGITPIPQKALGGYIEANGLNYLHAGETVLPSNPKRAYDLAMAHMERVNMPLGARGNAGASAGGRVYLYVDNSLNSAMLSSQIRVESIGVTTEIIKRGMR